MSDVFVSYKAEDRRRVKPLVEALESDGFSVWWDEQIGGGAVWRHEIETELNAARCVIVAWSKRSVGPEGTFVQDEAARAQLRHVYVPVRIDKVHLPLGFGETQALPLIGWRGNRSDARYQAVLAAVRRLTGREAQAGSSDARPPLDRRAVLAGSAVAAVGIGGLGAWALLKPDAAEAVTKSVAVLPFANLSGDAGQAYFSDGIAEELRSALTRLGGLRVVGRTSSEAVRNDDAQTAAKKLGVENILTGSVRQSPSTIRVSAQLVDGRSGLESWSDTYDRPPGDSIQIQSDIAQNVARALRVTLGGGAQATVAVAGTTNAEAQKLVLQANQLSYGASTRSAMDHAIGLIDDALKLDPKYAEAYALKGILVLVKVNGHARSPEELAQGRAESRRLAEVALRLDPDLPIGHGALAEIYRSELQLRPAFQAYKRVFALVSGDPDALRSYARFLSAVGDQGQALQAARKAVVLDPLNSGSYAVRARVLYDMRRYREVVRLAEELKRKSPGLFNHRLSLGNSLMMLGRVDEARRQYADAPSDDPIRLAAEAVLAARTRDRATALQTMRRLQQLYGDAASYQYAQIHAQLGDVDQAFAALERGWQIKDGGMLSVRVDPWLDPLRKDRRFAALLREMNFPA